MNGTSEQVKNGGKNSGEFLRRIIEKNKSRDKQGAKS